VGQDSDEFGSVACDSFEHDPDPATPGDRVELHDLIVGPKNEVLSREGKPELPALSKKVSLLVPADPPVLTQSRIRVFGETVGVNVVA